MDGRNGERFILVLQKLEALYGFGTRLLPPTDWAFLLKVLLYLVKLWEKKKAPKPWPKKIYNFHSVVRADQEVFCVDTDMTERKEGLGFHTWIFLIKREI